ncbi:helix-turn-helix domain-containing protein [Kitasatospora sp. LaBMicrA B282]|uniref:helix-turn-helix domain-containing protein n=1 Tax=Kitasatospora sp. LaBMicrA B282 TaxID=3420949 RepID=UPI003D0EC62E
MSLNRNPTVRQRILARTLRHLRDAAGITAVAAVQHLGCSESKISRIENAQIGVKKGDLLLLLDLYQVGSKRAREDIVGLARGSGRRGWWDRHVAEVPPVYADYIALESDAAEVYNIETILIPGLLQTEDYARAVVRAQRPNIESARVDLLAEIRMQRQSVLTASRPVKLWAIIAESVLSHRVGSPDVMRDQLEYLLQKSELPNVSVQILADSSFAHAMLSTSAEWS